MKQILIIAAPFGFGPPSKALILAEYLRGRYKVSISSTGSAVEFLQANAPEDVDILQGLFRKAFATRETLTGFDAFISVNQVPALHHLAALGFAERSVFVDSISQWRAEFEPGSLPKGLLAHIVQDEFPESASDRVRHPASAVVTAPLLWPDEVRPATDERRGVLVHTGGMTSPTAGMDLISVITSDLIVPILASISGCGHKVSLLGNADAFRGLQGALGLNVLGSVSPASAFQAIGGAKLLITTPGNGAMYEAMSKRTPLILLPPINSTQLQHYRVMTRHGIVGILGEPARDAISARLAALPWQHQTPTLLKILAANASNIVRMADTVLDRVFAKEGNFNLEDYLAKVDVLWASLSQVSPQASIIQALDRLFTPAS
jgi:hypothetical protein